MKKQFIFLSALCVIVTACDNPHSSPNVDNTARNIRDRGQTITPSDQSENEVDRTITQKIRQGIMEDPALSFNAKNIKIITINGVVTLRGVVNQEKEKIEITKKIKSISGVRNVDNQLEIIQK